MIRDFLPNCGLPREHPRAIAGGRGGRRAGFLCCVGLAPKSNQHENAEVDASMLTVEISLPEGEELQKLVQEGLEKGLLNYDEIASGLDEVELSKEQVEDFYTYLIDHGVELVEGETHKHPPHEQPNLAEEGIKTPKLDLTVEPSLDSLRLYLREIGKVPLLTADQEVYLAKRIERGDMSAKTQMIEANLRLVVSIAEEEESELGDFVEDEQAESPFDTAQVSLRREDIDNALASLPERDRKVIEPRFGLSGAQPCTLEEVGKAFGVTRERIRQIENNTLKKLESLPEAQGLKDCV